LLAPVSRRYWWVNYRQAARQEIDGGYLWSARRSSGAAGNASYEKLAQVMPGDVVFACAEERIAAIGIVLERVRAAPAPPGSAASDRQRRAPAGWLLAVRFEALTNPLLPKDHLRELAGLLPARHSPLRATGEPNERVQLAQLPGELVAQLGQLLGGQLQEIEARVAVESGERLADAALEEHIWQRADLAPRQKRQQLSARLGQGLFRANVEAVEQACRVTGVLDRRHLRATHIKPWRLCDEREQLDGLNGLLLSPHIAHLFERGQVSFADDGTLLLSRHLNPAVISAWGLAARQPPRPFRPEQCAYLEFHRRNIFEKVSSGRRG